MTAAGASPPEASSLAIHTVTYVEVAPSAASQGATALEHYHAAISKDGGAERVQLLQRLDRPNQLVVLTDWKDLASVDAQAAALVNLERELESISAAPSDTRQHRGLAVAEAPAAPETAITAVTHVDVVPAEKDNGLVALEELARASRQHDGNVRFDVWQQTNRPNHFTMVEHTRAFRRKLASMTGALYDERLYQALR